LCETEGHDWLDPDPVTLRSHCRRCLAFQKGLPDRAHDLMRDGTVGEPIGWLPDEAKTYAGKPNPEYDRALTRMKDR
jgi:hypothetical protein